MELQRLELTNFKGIKKFVFEPKGNSAAIYGKNGIGKTTIADANSWLLFDRDIHGKSPDSFGIKRRVTKEDDPNYMEVIHHLDHEVKGEYLHEGKVLKLRKTYKENWVRSRGEKDRNLKGHFTEYYVNGDSVSMSDYKKKIEDIASYDTFMMLTLPDYFAEQLHWRDRQNILVDLAGDVTDQDVIASDDRFERIPEILGESNVDTAKDTLNRKRREANKELESIPNRIDELERSLSDAPDKDEQKALVKKHEKEKKELEEKLRKTGSEKVGELKTELQDIIAKKTKRKNELEESQYSEKISTLRDAVEDLKDDISEMKDKQRKAEHTITQYADAISEADPTPIEKKLEEVQQSEPKEFQKPGDCPTCGQPLPEDEVKEAREKHEAYVEEFNEKKANLIKSHNEAIEEARKEIRDLEKEKQEAHDRLAELNKKLSQMETELEEKQTQLKNVKEMKVDPLSDDKYLELIEEQSDLEKQIKNLESNAEQQRKDIRNQIDAVDEKIKECNRKIAKSETQEQTKDRIQELRDEIDHHSEQLQQYETDLWLLDEFVQAKAEMISEKVNDQFEMVNWKMYDVLLNGGIDDQMCDAIINGVPFKESPSTSERIRAGIDIIRTLSRHFGIKAPVFVDRRESITELPGEGLQVISLIVSPSDDELRVEVE